MKYGKLILMSLLIMILTLGAVSAAEDAESNQNLADDGCHDMIEAEEDSAIVLEKNSGDIINGNVDIIVDKKVRVDDYKESSIAYVYDKDYLNGNISLQIDDKDVFHTQFKEQDEEVWYYVMMYDLSEVPNMGIHKVKMTYQKIGVDKPYTVVKNVNFTFTFNVIINDDMDRTNADIRYDESLYVALCVPDDANPEITFKLDGKRIKDTLPSGSAVIFKEKKFKPGKHTLEIIFRDKSNKYPERYVAIHITVNPAVYYPFTMSLNEKDAIKIKATKGTKITATLYNYNRKTKFTKASGTTSLSIPIGDYLKKGENNFYLSYSCDGFKSGEYIFTNYFKNSDKISVNLKKIGDSVKVTLKGPKDDIVYIDVYLDNVDKVYESIGFKKGYFKKTLSGLSIGKHKIKVVFQNGKIKYSNTFFVKVNAKDKVSLDLKKADVRKSAKRLVLKATLKINKKAKKGLKVTFKFNGKTFKAKTNKKGVAKITVKKKFLKKLKVGKTVKYQATYSFKTVKKSVKVKK